MVERELDLSLKSVMAELLVDIEEYEAPGCFGGHVETGVGIDPAREMLLSKIAGSCDSLDVMVIPCSRCYRAIKSLSRGSPVKMPRVLHPLEFLATHVPSETLRSKRTRDTTGLKVTPFYGCVFKKACGGEEEGAQPRFMEDFFEKLGLVTTWFPESNECCGGPKYLDTPDAMGALSKKIMDAASNWDVDIISVACAQCRSLLEDYGRGDRIIGDDKVAVMYYSQVAGYLMGLDRGTLFPVPNA